MVDNPFNDYSKNIFIQGGPIFGEGLPENLRKMGNNRASIVMQIRGGQFRKRISVPTAAQVFGNRITISDIYIQDINI